MQDAIEHKGGCHCGAVRFVAIAPPDSVVQACNCSICSMTGFVHLIVPASRFRLLSDKSALTTYQFNSKVARHLFCATCGIKSFYVPRSNPDGFSINVRCLDDATTGQFQIETFDGRHWEDNAGRLQHLSDND